MTKRSIENLKQIPYAIVERLLRLDEATGALFWKERTPDLFKVASDCPGWNKRYAGKEAFINVSKGERSGYKIGSIFKQRFPAHRIVWLLVNKEWPNGFIDHIDGNPVNNIPSNLRVVTIAENSRNMKRHSTNTSGYTGVHWDKTKKRWRASIKVDGVTKRLGKFRKIEDAAAARKAAEARYGFHPNHGRVSSPTPTSLNRGTGHPPGRSRAEERV